MRIPAPRKMETTDGISSRGGSTIPTIPTKVSSVLARCMTASSNWLDVVEARSDSLGTVLRARRITRLPCDDHVSLISSILARVISSRTLVSPSKVVYLEHRPIRTSVAPLIVRRL